MKAQRAERDAAVARLREWLRPGDTVHTILRHVSRSGMRREIGVVILGADGSDLHPNYLVAKALGERLNKRGDGVVVGGCGMDMGFHIVYSLARTLWPDGHGCTGERCPSNDHSNGDRDYTPHCHSWIPSPEQIRGGSGTPKGNYREHWHRDGGYALRQRWL
jgi:hypothetical protein